MQAGSTLNGVLPEWLPPQKTWFLAIFGPSKHLQEKFECLIGHFKASAFWCFGLRRFGQHALSPVRASMLGTGRGAGGGSHHLRVGLGSLGTDRQPALAGKNRRGRRLYLPGAEHVAKLSGILSPVYRLGSARPQLRVFPDSRLKSANLKFSLSSL